MPTIRTSASSISRAASNFKRAIQESLLSSEYTATDREKALQFFGGCAYCKEEAPRNDHLIPVSEWGEFTVRNVVPACQSCDDSRGQREYREWMRNGKSPRSLSARNFDAKHLEMRIALIEAWTSGYVPQTIEFLGEYAAEFEAIVSNINQVTVRAQTLVADVKRLRRNMPVKSNASSKPR